LAGSSALAVLAIGLACSPDDLVGPPDHRLDAIGLRPQYYTAGGASGSIQIGVPADNGPPTQGGVAPVQVVTASKYDFVQFEVTGTVTGSHTSYCTPPVGPTGSWGPSGEPGGGFRIHFSTSPNIGGLPTSGQGTSTLLVNRGIDSNVTISAERIGAVFACSGGPGLYLTGSHTVSYEVYPLYDITASPGYVALGDSITFTASSHWTTTGESWRFRENDTTSTPAGAHYTAKYLCTSASTCTYAPAKSGRIYRVGTFPAPDNGQYWMPGPIVWVGTPPQFTLDVSASSGTINRGDSVDFTVRNTGAGGELNALDELVWTFEPDSVPFYPSSSVKFAPPPVVDTVTAADSVWSGRIVHPGQIIVTGTSGGNNHVDTIPVSVSDRLWGPPEVDIVQDSLQTYPPDPPIQSATSWVAGRLHTLEGGYGNQSFTPADIVTGTVSTGPNQGYVFLESAAYAMHRAYSFNRWILNPGDVYHAGLTTWEYVEDQGGDPQLFFNNTLQHEAGQVSNSHAQRQNIAGASFAACGDLSKAVERLVAPDGTTLALWMNQARDRATDAVWHLADHTHVSGFQQQPNPVAEWDNTRPGVRNGLEDDAVLEYPTPPDSAFCIVAGV